MAITSCVSVSTTDMIPPFSDVTYARELSGENSDDRGRGPTSNCSATSRVSTSMAVTWLSSSDVT